MFKTGFIWCIGIFISIQASSTTVLGTILDIHQNPIPGVWVYLPQQRLSATTDINGSFQLKVSPGNITFQFKSIGFDDLTESKWVEGKEMKITFVLKDKDIQLIGLQISADRSDFAKELMQKAAARYQYKKENSPILQYQLYQKVSVQGPAKKPKGEDVVIDSAQVEAMDELKEDDDDSTRFQKWMRRTFVRLYKRKDSLEYIRTHSPAYLFVKDSIPEFRQMHLTEIHSNAYFGKKENYFESVNGYKKYGPYRPWTEQAGFSIGFEYGEKEIFSSRDLWEDPYAYESHFALQEFEILDHDLDNLQVSQKRVTSPFSKMGLLAYRYNVIDVKTELGKNTYCVQILPLFKNEAQIEGQIWIEDSSYVVQSIAYDFTPRALTFHHQFHFEEQFQLLDSLIIPTQRAIHYSIIEEKDTIIGSTQILLDSAQYSIQPISFGLEVQKFTTQSDHQPEDFWQNNRPLALDSLEYQYSHFCDSVQQKYKSNRYKEIRDSLYNRVSFWDVTLNGMGFRNSIREFSYFINPMIAQIQPLSVGGYRHNFGGSVRKQLNDRFYLDVRGVVSYGFLNNDVNGELGVSFGYRPDKFMRTSISAGDRFERLNTYASLGTLFARSNFYRARTINIAQRMEIFNGLYGEVTFYYNQQKAISGLQQDRWSDEVFGSLNQPTDFDTYTKAEIRLDLQYKIGQRFYMRRGRKVLIPNKNPEITFIYRKGIPHIFNSQVNFDFAEMTIKQSYNLRGIGMGDWNVCIGSFLNKKDLRIVEHKYFRGSDPFFFSDPTRSFQLLGPVFNTTDPYLRANYIHHFNGLLLNKIPLINKLKITEAAGIATLYLQDKKFLHQELYLGLERVIRIKKQLFRLGIFACSSDNNFQAANLNYKVGLSFFNTYSKRWSY